MPRAVPRLSYMVSWCYGVAVRTTLNIEDDVLRAVRSIAAERGRSMGDVVSGLLRRALRPERAPAYRGDFPVFEVREDSPPITPEMVRRALDEE